jgi:hypothetical protein
VEKQKLLGWIRAAANDTIYLGSLVPYVIKLNGTLVTEKTKSVHI